MTDHVWTTIDRALASARPPRSWAWLALKLNTNDQVVNNWKRRQVPPSRYPEVARILGWTVEELLAGGPDGPANRTGRDGGPWRLGQALDEQQHPAERLSDALGDALQGLPASLYSRSVDACRRLAEAPDSQRARGELREVLQHSASLVPISPGFISADIDRTFREAFYRVLDLLKSKSAQDEFKNLRDGIEHEVAKTLRLDIDQARRALAARQLEQG